MKPLRAYQIDIQSLGEKVYHFEYEVGDTFFEQFEGSPIQKGSLSVFLQLEKTARLIKLNFNIRGLVELVCDRSLDPFDQILNLQNEIIVKYGEREEELTEEIITITRDTQKLDMAQFIYEFVLLSLPMKKLHPRFTNESKAEEDEEEYTLIYRTEEEEKSEEREAIDPRWEKLKQISTN